MTNHITMLAIKKAMQSKCRFKIGCIAFSRKGDVIGTFVNQHHINKKGQSIHAEISAIRTLGKSIKTLIICRVNKSGKLLPIDPCDNCAKMAKRYNIDIKTIM